jgi:uncharacterized membrane protein (GlpM family)
MKPTLNTSLVALAGALIAIYFEIVAASNLRFLSHRAGLLITLWTVMPYVIFWAGKYFFQRCDIQKQWLHFAVFEVLLVAWIYWQTLFMYPDAQDSLIFLFLPLIQAGLNLAVGVLLYWRQSTLARKGARDGGE